MDLLDSNISRESFRSIVLEDYQIVVKSREISRLAKREVLQGRASFGIFGDGKELPQAVMARYVKKGDFISGYYRDQTLCFAKDLISIENYFAQLYADTEQGHDPCSGGRQMVCHFATPFIDEEGNPLDLASRYNVAANVSQTAGQFPRSIGLAYTSKIFKRQSALQEKYPGLSDKGREVCFATIGDASTAEGHFWETVHTAAVLQIPLVFFIWDDDYGISVPSKNHIAKRSISEALKGMANNGSPEDKGIDIYTVKGWDYASMHSLFKSGIEKARESHIPALFHVQELTQPLGHSTSGSHERYKSAERLQWEKDFDCNKKMREWILENRIADEEEMRRIEEEQKEAVVQAKNRAWEDYCSPIKTQEKKQREIVEGLRKEEKNAARKEILEEFLQRLDAHPPLHRYEIQRDAVSLQQRLSVRKGNYKSLNAFVSDLQKDNKEKYGSFLYAPKGAAADAELVLPEYPKEAEMINGYQIINQYFDHVFEGNDKVFAFGEDVGKIGDVNQGFSHLQEKYGADRIFDTGIRELTIVGQAIGMALRGLRPIAEIQYLDYLLYALQPLSDDVATLRYRTAGIQSCPLIIRTRGHRLEGIWHSGSPMGMMLNALRGIVIGTPRNMTQAAAMYNTLLKSNDPGIVIESLNGYRLKEPLPRNLSSIQLPFGLCEVLRKGKDITLVSYGSTLRIVQEVAERIYAEAKIDCEVIDIQTIIPFDRTDLILKSLKKTNKIIFIDEDYEGGFSAYMMNEIIEKRGGFYHLDATPRTISAYDHRTSYGRDGEYFSKPNAESIWEGIMQVIRE